MMSPLFWQALLAGIGLTVLSGPLGVLTVWRRLAFLGDSLAHASILGVALGVLLQINMSIAVFVMVCAVAFLLMLLMIDRALPSDAILAVISYGALSAGLLLIGANDLPVQNYTNLLMGDILSVSRHEIAMIWGMALIVGVILKYIGDKLILIALDESLAKVEGIQTRTLNGLFCVLLALCIALGTKLVGALLMSALLIIPAASSRALSNTPERMWIASIVLGSLSVLLGLILSFFFDLPTGPAIVMMSVLFFILTRVAHDKIRSEDPR